MPILFFDTETTGFVDYALPADHLAQPHVVQLAAILTDDEGVERSSLSLIVNPGVPIPHDAAKVHGITDEVAHQFGVPPEAACRAFLAMTGRAGTLVAHNIRFDSAVMAAALARSLCTPLPAMTQLCTMEIASPVVNLPPTPRMIRAGYGGKPKAPSLSECVRHFFDERLDGAHDALVDVRACARVFFHLRMLATRPVAVDADSAA